MLTNEARRDILNRVKSSGYPGGVSEAFRAAEQGVDVIDQFVKQQQQEQQQEMQASQQQQQMQGDERMPQEASSPPPPPMSMPDGRVSQPNLNQPIDNNQGHLVQSENAQNVGIQSLPTGSAQGQVIQAKEGGLRQFHAGGLYHNINHKKKSGTSKSKSNSTISKKAYSNMKSGFKKETGGVRNYKNGGNPIRENLQQNYNLPLLPGNSYPEYSPNQLNKYLSPSQQKISNWLKSRKNTGRFDDQLGDGNLERQQLNLAGVKTIQKNENFNQAQYEFYKNQGYLTDVYTGEKFPPFETAEEYAVPSSGRYDPNPHILYDKKTDVGNKSINRISERIDAYVSGKPTDTTQKHENTHALNAKIAEKLISEIRPFEHEYFDDPREIYSRLMEFRLNNNISPDKIFKKKDLKKYKKELKTYTLDYMTEEQKLKLLNDVADASEIQDTDTQMAQTGGVRKYATGGLNNNSDDDLEKAYEQYTLNKDMEDDMRSEEGGSNHSSSISYNQFKKIASTQGLDVASQYYSKEDGKTTSKVNQEFFNRDAMREQSPGNVRSWSAANQKTYYDKLASQSSMMSASDFRYIDDEKLKAQNTTAPGFESELSLEQQKILATPDTFKEKGAWSAGNLANFGREWDHSDRVVSGDSGIGNYYFGGGTENTYKPSYSYGTDAKTDKAFFADTKGNPVGTHYKDGTPYSKELMSRNSYGGGDKKLSMLDDGSKLKERYDFADKVMYNYIPSTIAAVGSLGGSTLTRAAAKPIVRYGTQGVNAFKNMLSPLGQGTSNIYRLRQGASGLYNSAKAGSVPAVYNTVGNQIGKEVMGQGTYKNRTNTFAKLTDIIPALSGAKEGIKIGSDIANNDYLSAGTRLATKFVPGFTKSKQFGTGLFYHGAKLANSFINTKPTNKPKTTDINTSLTSQNITPQFEFKNPFSLKRDGGVRRYSRRRGGYFPKYL